MLDDHDHEVGVREDRPHVFWNGKGYVSQQVLVTIDAAGNECRWTYAGQTDVRGNYESNKTRNNRLAEERKRVAESGEVPHQVTQVEQCQWFIESGWRYGQCSRDAVATVYGGAALCWQHADRTYSDTLARLEENKLTPLQVERLTHALLEAQKQLGGFSGHYGQISTSPLVYTEVRTYLKRVIAGDARLDGPIKDLLDQLIEQRIEQRWGEDEDETKHLVSRRNNTH